MMNSGPRESLRMILKPLYNIYTADNGQKALEVIKSSPVDLVTLDLKMQGTSGHRCIKGDKKVQLGY